MHTFNFQCQTCGEQFNLKTRQILKNNCTVACPSCLCTMPASSLYHLREIAVALEGYAQSETDQDGGFFKFTIR